MVTRWKTDRIHVDRPGRPWRINILDIQSGAIREAAHSGDSQGAQPGPPDGKSIIYGEVECESTHSCAIHRIDLATGKVGTLPDSDGFMTARWSPNGPFIAALNPEQSQVMLFDVKSEKWRKLADAITGPDLSWSADSNYLYANIPGTDAQIVRIRIEDGSRKTMFEFRSQDKFDLADSRTLNSPWRRTTPSFCITESCLRRSTHMTSEKTDSDRRLSLVDFRDMPPFGIERPVGRSPFYFARISGPFFPHPVNRMPEGGPCWDFFPRP